MSVRTLLTPESVRERLAEESEKLGEALQTSTENDEVNVPIDADIAKKVAGISSKV